MIHQQKGFSQEKNKEGVFKYIPQTNAVSLKEVEEMLSLTEFAEERGERRGIKQGIKLTLAVLKTLKIHPDWTDKQIAEYHDCEEEDVTEIRND